MQWIEVSVPTRSDEIDDVCAQLAELGAGGMVVEDEADFQDFLEHNHQYWDYVDDALEAQFRGVSRIKFYLSDDDDGRAQLASIRAGIGRELTTATVCDSDWENNWRQYYQPIAVGEKLVVVPEWLDAPADGRIALRLDPGLIFGTGSHPTTRMCLAALEQYAGAGKTALDLGCGSGILGIGALLLGCASVACLRLGQKAHGRRAGRHGFGGCGCRGENIRARAMLLCGCASAAALHLLPLAALLLGAVGCCRRVGLLLGCAQCCAYTRAIFCAGGAAICAAGVAACARFRDCALCPLSVAAMPSAAAFIASLYAAAARRSAVWLAAYITSARSRSDRRARAKRAIRLSRSPWVMIALIPPLVASSGAFSGAAKLEKVT